MADRHDEAARELLDEWRRGTYVGEFGAEDRWLARRIASALRKAEADGLREAAKLAICVACFAEGTADGAAYAEGFTDAQSSIAARLRARAAEKGTK